MNNNNVKVKRKKKNNKGRKQTKASRPWVVQKAEQALDVWNSASRFMGGFNTEQKMFDKLYTGTPSTTGAVVGHSLIAQGDGVSDRNGISIKAVGINQVLHFAANASATQTFVRNILFIDLNQAGTAPTVADVLETSTTLSQLNKVNLNRFVVLDDRTVSLDTAGGTTTLHSKVFAHTWHIKYLDGTANQTGQGIGNVYVLQISDQVTNTPSVKVSTRLFYVDN
jgi:hypothetical protein